MWGISIWRSHFGRNCRTFCRLSSFFGGGVGGITVFEGNPIFTRLTQLNSTLFTTFKPTVAPCKVLYIKSKLKRSKTKMSFKFNQDSKDKLPLGNLPKRSKDGDNCWDSFVFLLRLTWPKSDDQFEDWPWVSTLQMFHGKKMHGDLLLSCLAHAHNFMRCVQGTGLLDDCKY